MKISLNLKYKILDIIPKWSGLSRIGRNKIMQYTVLVPVFGYFIIFSDWLRENLTVFENFPEWNLFALYYGLTFLAMASLIYTFRCPEAVKLHPSQIDYINNHFQLKSESHVYQLVCKVFDSCKRNTKMIWYLLDKDTVSCIAEYCSAPTLLDKLNVADKTSKLFYDCFGIDEQNYSEKNLRIFLHDCYTIYNHLHAKSRLIVSALYLIGFALLAIPTITMFFEIAYRTIQMANKQ